MKKNKRLITERLATGERWTRRETDREYWVRKAKGFGLAFLGDVLLVGGICAPMPNPVLCFIAFNALAAALLGTVLLIIRGLTIAFPDL